MSLGGGKFSSFCNTDSRKAAIDNLRTVNVATVISSGNNGYNGFVGAPGCISTAMTVGATTDSDGVASFSNHATLVDFLAPGVSVLSSVPGGGYSSWNGTSMAAPHVTGAFAALMDRVPSATETAIETALEITGLSVTRSGITKPRIRVYQALNYLLPRPDLVVINPAVTDSTPYINQVFTLSTTVKNQGTASSASTTLRYYRSTNSIISTGDTQICTDFVSSLLPNGTSPESCPVSIATAGTYWVGACVDAVSGESSTTNNCSSGVQVTVSGRPDLVVINPAVTDSTPYIGQVFNISATVKNQGTASSASTTLRYYRSTNSIISTGDTQICTDFVSSLLPNGTSPESCPVSIATVGTYWVGACVDAVSGESPTTNNCSSGVQVIVTGRPDLVVINPGVSDPTPGAGVVFNINATVKNQGGGISAATTLRYYRSTNSTINTGDTQICTDFVSSLLPNGTSPESCPVSIATAGTYWVGGCVDAVSGESSTANNCSSGVKVTVGSFANDLVVSFGDAGIVKGLWRWMNNSAWKKLHKIPGMAIAIGDIDDNGVDDVIVALPGKGTWRWMNNTVFLKLHNKVADVIVAGDLDSNGKDDLVLALPGIGTWRWMNNSAWDRLHGIPATAIAVGDIDGNGVDDVIVALPGKGTWRWMNNTVFLKLHNKVADVIVAGNLDSNGKDDLVLALPGIGTWRWMNNSVWDRLHGIPATAMAVGDIDGNGVDDVIVALPGKGTWRWMNNTVFLKLHNKVADVIVAGDLDSNGKDDVVLALPGAGTWRWMNNSAWDKLHKQVVEGGASGNIDGL